MGVSAVLTCVDYDDYLALTLPRNARFFERIVVVTVASDEGTRRVVASVPNALRCVTDAFYRRGAVFNKGAALEAGFDFLGRAGWICVLDADTLLPGDADLAFACRPERIGTLMGCHRLILPASAVQPDGIDHSRAVPCPEDGPADIPGFFQLFHADDPRLASRPWYPTEWEHAGGCDTEFYEKWAPSARMKLEMVVYSLGEPFANWAGRITPRLDGSPIPNAAEREAWSRRIQRDYGAYKRAYPWRQ